MRAARPLLATAVLAFAVLMSGCGGSDPGHPSEGTTNAGGEADVSDIRVDTIRDVTFNVEGFDTYAWVAAAAAVRDPEHRWTPSGLDVASELKFLVDRELRKHGRSPVVRDPKMVALFAVGVDMKAVEVSVNPDSGVKTFEEAAKGALFVYLVHPRTRYVVWAGRAIGDVADAPTIEEAKARLEHAVTRMFADFPN